MKNVVKINYVIIKIKLNKDNKIYYYELWENGIHKASPPSFLHI